MEMLSRHLARREFTDAHVDGCNLYDLMAIGEVESVHIGSCRRTPVEGLQRYVDRLRAQDGT